jgi:hypothetical protein
MITQKDDRMLELLWLVAYSGGFPTQMAQRIGGHPEWNRHVMYRAIRKEYVERRCWTYRKKTIRLLQITDKGMEYIATRDPENAALLLSMRERYRLHLDAKKASRANSVAVGLVMASNAGAVIHPRMKPSLLFSEREGKSVPDPSKSYYYSVREIRESIQEYNTSTMAKTSRILGVIVHGRYCYFLYFTGAGRMYWRAPTELNTFFSVQALLRSRGFECDIWSQVIIGSNMHVAEKIARRGVDVRGKYLSLDSQFNNSYYVTNDANGDALLRLITYGDLREQFNRNILSESYRMPDSVNRRFDALTSDGRRPVILCYQCDLLKLAAIRKHESGYDETPIILCMDYQVDAIQRIVGGRIEVQAIQTPIPI